MYRRAPFPSLGLTQFVSVRTLAETFRRPKRLKFGEICYTSTTFPYGHNHAKHEDKLLKILPFNRVHCTKLCISISDSRKRFLWNRLSTYTLNSVAFRLENKK
uniref:Uncharacterized protein n=1 Tax=Romanomermis culicivorax TaxID=13658 RepID=A0A915ICV6_ROMCU